MLWMTEEEAALRNATHASIAAAFEVRRELGGALSARVYRAAMWVEVESRGVRALENVELVVKFRGRIVGEFFADLLVDERLLVLVRAIPAITPRELSDAQQLLAATRVQAGLLLNFGAPKLEYRRLRRA